MKIAILGTRGIPARYGGFETFAEELGTRLAERGVAVTIFCETSGGDGPAEHRGVRLRYVPAPRLGPLSTLLFDLRCVWASRRGYDVVYMLGYGASLFCFLPRLWGSRVWINMDGIEWARSKWSWFARLWLKTMESIALWTANVIIADADAVAGHLRRRHGNVPELHVIPYGAELVQQPPDTAPLARWGLERERYYLIVCRLEPENHVRELIEGYLRSSSDYPLVIAGDRNAGTRYVRDLLELGGPRVRFIGTVYERPALTSLRYHSCAYLHGHSVGGTNPSLLEALGCGNMVIAHDNPFNREVAGDAAWYVDGPGAVAGSLAEVERLHGEERAMQHERSRRRIRDRYTWSAVTERYLELLQTPVA